MMRSTLKKHAVKKQQHHQPQPNSHDKPGNHSLIKVALVFATQALVLLASFIPYLRLHKIDIASMVFDAQPREPIRFDFVDNNFAVGSIIEAFFWSGIAVCVRWMGLTIALARRKESNALRQLMEWAADLLSTPLLTIVIVYALRSPRISLGKSINLSLDDAGLGVFILLGFLLGFFGSAQIILMGIWKRTFGAYNSNPPSDTDENDKTTKDRQ